MTGLRVVRIIALIMLGLAPVICAQQNGPEPPNCTKGDLEIHFGFFESPTGFFNFVVLGKNVSDHACTFLDELFDPRFSGSSPQFKCQDCGKRQREGFRDDSAATSDPVVEPRDIVRKQYRWRTTPEQDSTQCFRPEGMNSEYSYTWALVTPTLMPEVCSDISVTGTDVLAPRDSYQMQAQWSNVLTIKGFEPLTLTALRSAVYIDEKFPLTVSHKYGPPPGSEPGKCRPIYIWHRSADGTVRVEEFSDSSTDGCRTLSLEFLPNKIFFSSDWNSEKAKRLSNYGDQQLQAFERIDSKGDPHFHFIASDIVHVQIEGAESPQLRNWSRLKGLAADILLDRDTYKIGEDIPLHIAVANFNAPVPIYSWDPDWDPCISIGIEVLDAEGKPLPENERVEYPPVLCSGHGFGPKLFDRGRITALEWHLKSTGWLPSHPGTYTIVLSWCTSSGSVSNTSNGWRADLKPYATVEAMATILIIPASAQEPGK